MHSRSTGTTTTLPASPHSSSSSHNRSLASTTTTTTTTTLIYSVLDMSEALFQRLTITCYYFYYYYHYQAIRLPEAWALEECEQGGGDIWFKSISGVAVAALSAI